TRGWTHLELPRKLPGRKFGTKPHFVRRDDVQLNYIVGTGGSVSSKSNTEFFQRAKFYLDEEQRKYQVRTPAAAVYPGIRAIDPDGAIQQITWTINERGGSTR